jgi:hypothetical protein
MLSNVTDCCFVVLGRGEIVLQSYFDLSIFSSSLKLRSQLAVLLFEHSGRHMIQK